MIRTEVVSLTVIPAAAYKQRLASDGTGIVILREDSAQPGIASVSKTSGKSIPLKNTPKDLFPREAFDEALQLTSGLPYKKRGAPTASEVQSLPRALPVVDRDEGLEVVIASKDYQKVVDEYTDEDGRLSYDLLNRAMIRFAHTSSIVKKMFEERRSLPKIRLYIIGTKFRTITKNRALSDEQILKMADLLDEVYPEGVFVDLNRELRRMKAMA